jgi:hypothetical protein
MTTLSRDPDYSELEIEDAVLDLMHVLGVPHPVADDGVVLLVEHLLVREIDFLYDLVAEMSSDGKRFFRQYLSHTAVWRNERGGVMKRDAPVAHALTLAAVIVPLIEKYYDSYAGVISASGITEWVNEAMENYRSCAQRYLPNDGIAERDLPLIRGEMMTNIILRRMGITSGAGVYSNEFFVWLGSHEDDVVRMYEEIILRRTFDPEFVRDLLGGGKVGRALGEGVL